MTKPIAQEKHSPTDSPLPYTKQVSTARRSRTNHTTTSPANERGMQILVSQKVLVESHRSAHNKPLVLKDIRHLLVVGPRRASVLARLRLPRCARNDMVVRGCATYEERRHYERGRE